MVGKKAKGGKKKKPVEAKSIPVQAYDLEVISRDDLKKYVASLEKELTLMRKDCAFYNTNKDKIKDFLDSRRNVFGSQKRMSVVDNVAWDDLVEQLRRFPDKYNEKTLIEAREKLRLRQASIFEDFVARSSAEAVHFDREQVLKQVIAEKDKRLELDQFFCEMTLMDMKERCQNVLEDMDHQYSKKLEGIFQQNAGKWLKDRQEFNADKIRTLISIWDISERTEEMKESYISQMKRMQDFFHEISSNNAEVIKLLRGKLANFLIENKKTNLNLNQMLLQNMKLREVQPPDFLQVGALNASARVSQTMGNIRVEKKLQKLKYTNEILTQQLFMVKDNLQNMKKQFISATRKLYQKAEFKAFVVEEIIQMTIQMECLEAIEEESRPEKREMGKREQKTQAINDVVNVFKMGVEKSDTLFVPPVYHEFWDSSVKYNKN